MTTNTDYYAFLGLARTASAEEIDGAFRERARVLHPDANKNNPKAAEEFKLLGQAYQVLKDPVRKMRYDAALPKEAAAKPAAAQPITDLAELWKATGQRYFEMAARYTPAVDALQKSVPLVIEETRNLLVVGIKPEDSRLIGYLELPEANNRVKMALSEMAGRSLDFRIIAGVTLKDWTELKDAEERLHKKRQDKTEGRIAQILNNNAKVNGTPSPLAIDAAVGPGIWDELVENLSRQWSATESRSFAQVRAKFVHDQLPSLARAEESCRLSGMAEEDIQRGVARVLDRAGTLVSLDGAVVALEYLRYRRLLMGGA